MRVCIIFKLRNDSTFARVRDDAPAIVSTVQSFAKGPLELVFRSNDGLLFGWFFETDKPLGMIQAEVAKCVGMTNDDGMILFEVGKGLAGLSGFSRAWTWLQHHPG